MQEALSQRQAVAYLLQRNLIDPACVVAGDLTVLDVSRRNRNLVVSTTNGPSYLLKQGMNSDGMATVAHEAAVYQFLRSDPRTDNVGLRRFLPEFYGYDEQERILILELVRDAKNFREHHSFTGDFSITLASTIGRALGALHSMPPAAGEFKRGLVFHDRVPRVLSIYRLPFGMLGSLSEANLRMIRIVQQDREFCDVLDDIHRDWRAERIIHHDLKWDNCLILRGLPRRRGHRLKLIDWELASRGDPCWDIGSVFSSYLTAWLSSIPIAGEEPPEQFLQLSRYPLERMQPAFRSFWASYLQCMNLAPPLAEQWLLRSVRYGAARLLQTEFEQMQMSNQLSGNTVCILQLSLNMMTHPDEAAVFLLGISRL